MSVLWPSVQAAGVTNAEVSLCLGTRRTEQHALHQLTADLHLQDETIKKACASEDQDFTNHSSDWLIRPAVDLSKVPSQRLDMDKQRIVCRKCIFYPY